MAGEIQLNSTTFATESGGTVTVSNVGSATNRQNLGLEIGVDVQSYDADTTKNDVANTFTANQIISVTDNTNAALRVTQLGTGNALVVEDETNPDSTPFVVDASGNVGIGTTVPNGKLHVQEAANLSESSPHIKIVGTGYQAYHWLDATAYYIGQNSGSRSLRLYSGAETAGVNLAASGTSWGTFSDERLKYDIEPITDGLTKLANVRCVSYRLKDVDEEDSQKKLGVIAQDLVGLVDEVIDTTKRSGDDTEYMSVRYTELIPVLVKAIQEQQTLIESQQSQIDELTARIEALETV